MSFDDYGYLTGLDDQDSVPDCPTSEQAGHYVVEVHGTPIGHGLLCHLIGEAVPSATLVRVSWVSDEQ